MKLKLLIGPALALALLTPGMAQAQFAVTDIIADAQTTETAVQQATAVAKQIQQYEMQVQQYQNMLTNTLAPSTNIYRQTTADISGLQTALDGVTRMVPVGQSMSQYLSQFTNGSGVSSSTDFCATQGLCSSTQIAAEMGANGAAAQARDAALVSGGQTQLTALQSQATDLQAITVAAQGATGQMQAIGYGNQIAAVGANANLQIASVLTQQMQQQAADRLAGQRALAMSSQANGTAGKAAVGALDGFYGQVPTGTYGQMAAGLPQIDKP